MATVAANNNPPAVPIPPVPAAAVAPVVDQGKSCCKSLVHVIAEIVIQVLLPFAIAFGLYFTLPLAAALIAFPIVAVTAGYAVSILFANGTRFPIHSAPPRGPLPDTAPRGIRNAETVQMPDGKVDAGNNCWINSLSQVMTSDKPMKDWFTNLPELLGPHLAEILHLAPVIISHISKTDAAVPEALNDLLGIDVEAEAFLAVEGNLDRYLERIHPALKKYFDQQDPADRKHRFGYASSLLRNCYPGLLANYPNEEEQFMQAVNTPEFLGNLYRRDRQRIPEFFQIYAQFPEEQRENIARYILFFAEIPAGERQGKWTVLSAFRDFFHAYANGVAGAPLNYHSQNLRAALNVLAPHFPGAEGGIDLGRRQIDPMEGLNPIFAHLIPNDLKVEVEERLYFHLDGKPAIANAVNGNVTIKRKESLEPGFTVLQIKGSHPNIADLFQLESDHNPGNLNVQTGADGVKREYLINRKETKYVKAPPSLWYQVKRMKDVTHGPWECLTGWLPSWFPGVQRGQEKLTIPVGAQDTLEIDTIEEGQARYKLDSFILHLGKTLQSGHYIGYKRGVDAEGNDIWYEMNDHVVTPLSHKKATELLSQAYCHHYSKI